MDYGYVYLVKEHRFLENNINIYTICKTTNNVDLNCADFLLLYFQKIKNYDNIEKIIINKLKDKFEQQNEIGYNYFKGNIVDILIEFTNVIFNFPDDIEIDMVMFKIHPVKYKILIDVIWDGIIEEYVILKKMVDSVNFREELDDNHKKKLINNYNSLKHIIECLKNNPNEGDYYTKKNNRTLHGMDISGLEDFMNNPNNNL